MKKSEIPFSAIEVNSFTMEVYRKSLDIDGSHVCEVDSKGFNDGEKIVMFPSCRHAVHSNCMRNWNKAHTNLCPTCWKKQDNQGILNIEE